MENSSICAEGANLEKVKANLKINKTTEGSRENRSFKSFIYDEAMD